MKRRTFVSLAGLAAPLAGCVALPYGTYYRPSSADPGARVRRAWCGGQAGPGSVLQIDGPLGLQLEATTDPPSPRRSAPGLPLRVRIALPGAAPLRFVEGPPSLVEPGSGRAIAVALAAHVRSQVRVASEATVDAAALRPAGTAGRSREAASPQGRASWTLELPADFAPASFELQLPAVVLQGQTIATPPLRLSRPGSDKRPGDYRSEAEQQHLREREAACRRDTPQLACENIVPYGQRSFERRAGPLRWEGEWARFEGGRAPTPVRATQHLTIAEPGPWRLADARFVLADLATGRQLALPLPATNILFDDRFDFATPLPAAAAAQVGPRLLFLEADLPEGLPAFELRLPPLQVGGQAVAIAPILFERRSFDGGIEPLNC